MKMLDEFLKEVVILTAGKQAEPIYSLLDSKKHVNEFLIAKKLDITINQTRNILYKLSDFGLVSSIRKKDKKKGWYTYFWKIEVLKSLNFLKELLEKRKEQINNQIQNRESKQFYVCETCRIEFNEENALLYDFTCNECGNTFSLKDNTKLLRELKKNFNKIDKKLMLIDEEIEKENAKIDKQKFKEAKKEAKELAEKKAAKKKATKEKTAKTKAAKKKFDKQKSTKKKSTKKKLAKKKVAKKKPSKKKVAKKKVDKKKTTRKAVKNKSAKNNPGKKKSAIKKRKKK